MRGVETKNDVSGAVRTGAPLLTGSTPKEIMTVEPNFVELLGLGQSLTPSRTNGFMNMLRLMQKKTLECYMASEAAKEGGD